MDLGAFLADESIGGSWADEEVDMSSIGVGSTAAPVSAYSHTELSDAYPRREREEYPVPDAPPFKARVANLPYEVSEDALARFFEDRLQARDIVEDVKLPMDQMSGRPKGFAFITFTEKAALEEALQLTMSEFSGRKIYVNVAAPQKTDAFDLDWRGGRSGPLGSAPRRDEQPDLDWGAARSAGPTGRDRERRPRREEVNVDWSSARSGAPLPARERRPRREEAELDWNAAASSGPLPPRERKPRREEPLLDWGSARSGAPLPARERKPEGEWSTRGPKKNEQTFDWKRGQTLAPKAKKAAAPGEEKEQAKPQKSLYDVLSLDASDDEEETVEEEKVAAPEATGLEQQVADLSVEDGWKTVGK